MRPSPTDWHPERVPGRAGFGARKSPTLPGVPSLGRRGAFLGPHISGVGCHAHARAGMLRRPEHQDVADQHGHASTRSEHQRLSIRGHATQHSTAYDSHTHAADNATRTAEPDANAVCPSIGTPCLRNGASTSRTTLARRLYRLHRHHFSRWHRLSRRKHLSRRDHLAGRYHLPRRRRQALPQHPVLRVQKRLRGVVRDGHIAELIVPDGAASRGLTRGHEGQPSACGKTGHRPDHRDFPTTHSDRPSENAMPRTRQPRRFSMTIS